MRSRWSLLTLVACVFLFGVHAYAQSQTLIYLPLVVGNNSSISTPTVPLQPTATVAVQPTVAATATIITIPSPSPTTPLPTIEVSDPLINGDFEMGDVGWERYDDSYIVNNSDLARNSNWFALLGSSDGVTDELYQVFTIPSDRPYLHYWYKASSSHADCYLDAAFVWVDDTPEDSSIGSIIHSHYDFCNEREFSEYRESVVDLRAYAGKRIELLFRMSTEPNYASYWSIDDITLSANP